MKKIIATVLAMVMALALCTTAFAKVQTYDLYDAKTGAAYEVADDVKAEDMGGRVNDELRMKNEE